MAPLQATKRLTPQEYYVLEREAEFRSEYRQGDMVAMACEGGRHSLIKVNLVATVSGQLRGKRPLLLGSDMRLRVRSNGLRCYPDATVYCGPIDYDSEDDQAETATNPMVIFEVLSKSTEAYDRGIKAESYRSIESLRAYVLISQVRAHVEVQERMPDGTWRLCGQQVWMELCGCLRIELELSLAELYDGIEFTEGVVVGTPA